MTWFNWSAHADTVGPRHLQDDGGLLASSRPWRRAGTTSDAHVGRQLEAKPKYVVSLTRKDFPWTHSHHIGGDLRTGVQQLKDATPDSVLLGSGKLATALDRLDLIDAYQLLVHPNIAGHGPTLFDGGLPRTRRLKWVSAKPLRNGARSPCTTGECADSQMGHAAAQCAALERASYCSTRRRARASPESPTCPKLRTPPMVFETKIKQ